MYKRSRNQVVKMIANAEVSAHEKWNYGEYEQPTTTLKTLKKKTAPTQKTPSSLSYIEIDGQQITDPLSMASAFYYNFTKIQLSANSAASADDDLQADMNFLTWAFGFFQNSNRWFYAIQCSSHDYQTSWREHKAYRGKQSYGSGWFWD